jgi:group II intron reverse transcriptase/maturase
MEGRDRQELNLSTGTHLGFIAEQDEHKGGVRAQGAAPLNRWERIGLAAEDKGKVFNNLLCHFNVETLCEAYKAMDANKAKGIDEMSKKTYGENLEANLRELHKRIHNGSYKPQSKREVLIPKANGKTRPIAISCFEDKLVEWVLGKTLSAIYEPLFIRNSFGFRPFKSAHGAIKEAYQALKDGKQPHVVEIDFANFFNSIPHRKLMKVLRKRISDRRLHGLIGRFLTVGILDQAGTLTEPEAGTPQGSIMSPILANVYLNEMLDQWFIRKYKPSEGVIVRYADDAIFVFRKEDEANGFLESLKERANAYGLTLNEDKTRRIDFGKGENNHFHFLGFTFYWGRKPRQVNKTLKVKTQQEKLSKKIQEFYCWIKKVRSFLKTSEIWKTATAKLIGHYNYFGFRSNHRKLYHFYWEATKSLFKWLNRRSQKQSYTWEQFKDRLKSCPLPMPPATRELKALQWSLA